MNKDLLLELEKSFMEWKKESGFKASFDELDEIFFIRDYIQHAGFVSDKINRMICGRIRDTFSAWVNQISLWLFPSQTLISFSESKVFDEKDREELNSILSEFMYIISLNTEIGLTKDKKKEGEFVDKSLEVWKKNLPLLIRFTSKVREFWIKK
ncbi:MAG: hypothetical protein KQA41_00020 [Candidatus Aenigmarchaeota archaeon]|nr:hypothetical protein [Candidatus Aenigmarchaeota archaeon]